MSSERPHGTMAGDDPLLIGGKPVPAQPRCTHPVVREGKCLSCGASVDEGSN